MQYWKHHIRNYSKYDKVVICFKISIFAILETSVSLDDYVCFML
ncbi:hypothetical protein HMPREF0663_11629 [Hoylesella oralis ATCC 33269]|uniref:Uncharacterized protein n=1 Tax=Hoylesella oralis ATCC 33269 TaxID=873533 RepID=E7RR28_9BACT|nr:hypothetical protein HMPREF0663_11629 [Hoylesella oralis ATCC 33269]